MSRGHGCNACWPPTLELELAGDLGVGQLLEMPEDEDFAVQRVHGVEGLLQPTLPLGADRGHAGAGVAAQELAARATEDASGTGRSSSCTSRSASRAWTPRCWRCRSLERHAGEPAEPEEHRLLGPFEVPRQGLGRLEKCLLEHVRRIDPALNRWSRRRATMRRRRSRCGSQDRPRPLVPPDRPLQRSRSSGESISRPLLVSISYKDRAGADPGQKKEILAMSLVGFRPIRKESIKRQCCHFPHRRVAPFKARGERPWYTHQVEGGLQLKPRRGGMFIARGESPWTESKN